MIHKVVLSLFSQITVYGNEQLQGGLWTQTIKWAHKLYQSMYYFLPLKVAAYIVDVVEALLVFICKCDFHNVYHQYTAFEKWVGGGLASSKSA